jgi:uncharacterized protein (TIRG00374 family)
VESTTKKTAKIAIQVLFAGAFLYLAFRHLEWDKARAVLGTTHLSTLTLGLFLLAAGFAIRIMRWWEVLRLFNDDLRATECAGPFLASLAVNNVIPLRAGDALRTFGFQEQLDVKPTRVLGSMVIERLLDLLVLLVFLIAGLWMAPTGQVPRPLLLTIWGGGGLAATALLALVLVPKQLKRLTDWILELSFLRGYSWTGAVKRWSSEFWESILVLQRPVLTLRLLALSVGAWALEGGAFWATAISINLGVSWEAALLALASGTLATLLPSTPGYAGTFDYFTMVAMKLHGVTQSTAAVYTLLIHLLLWAPVTAVGFSYLLVTQGREAVNQARAGATQQ